jgi:uncharacterized protein
VKRGIEWCASIAGTAGLMMVAVMVLWSCTHMPAARPAPLAGMPYVTLMVADEPHRVRLAHTPEARAQGFQHVPATDMDREAIYFQFDAPLRPTFHMRNVVAPLLIAWIAPSGAVVGVDLMRPGGDRYAPREVVVAALEFTPRHPLAQHVRPGVHIELEGSQLPL